MSNISNMTPIDLQRYANDCKKRHEELKEEITEKSKQIDVLESEINEKLSILKSVEEEYVNIIEEINKR